jgi:hypothetical protein
MSESLRLEEAVEFADNPEPRCPCILLLDISYSNNIVNRAAQRIRHLDEQVTLESPAGWGAV